jgi:hypothetical protein
MDAVGYEKLDSILFHVDMRSVGNVRGCDLL